MTNKDQTVFNQITAKTHNNTSPAGIDTKRAHVLFLRKLFQIEAAPKVQLIARREGLA